MNFIICLSDTLKGVCIAGEKLFTIQGSSSHLLSWEQYGLRISVPQDTFFPTDMVEIAVTALIGGQFQFPEYTELISAVYAVSVSKPLLKEVKLEIQHCADLVTQDHTSYLSFATASVNNGPPYQFQLKEGGQFCPGDQYGSICLSQFSLWSTIKNLPYRLWRWLTYDDTSVIQPNTTKDSESGMITNYIGSSSSDDDESAFQDAYSTLDPVLDSGNDVQLINQVEGIFYKVPYYFPFHMLHRKCTRNKF